MKKKNKESGQGLCPGRELWRRKCLHTLGSLLTSRETSLNRGRASSLRGESSNWFVEGKMEISLHRRSAPTPWAPLMDKLPTPQKSSKHIHVWFTRNNYTSFSLTRFERVGLPQCSHQSNSFWSELLSSFGFPGQEKPQNSFCFTLLYFGQAQIKFPDYFKSHQLWA